MMGMFGMKRMVYTVRIRWKDELRMESLIEIRKTAKGKEKERNVMIL
jgi:hypothetical protein